MEWNWILQTTTMFGIGAIGYFLKTTMAELKTQIQKNAQDVHELKKELDNLRSDLPFIYTTRVHLYYPRRFHSDHEQRGQEAR